MGKTLGFTLNGGLFGVVPEKIERKKLYGFNKTIVFDENGSECETANLDEGASGIIPRGGIGLGILSPEGLWVERASLKAVDMDGKDAALMKSCYDSTVALERKVPAEVLLDYCITGFYELPDSELAGAIGADIYMFDYCYRASYEPVTAFVLSAGRTAFMFVGYKAPFEMLSLPEEVTLDEEDEEECEEDEEIDFSMM